MANDLINGFSIIICTYNGASKIVPTLEHLAKLKNPHNLPIEIIFVDNNSTDGTSEVVAKTWERIENPSIDLILLNENQVGKFYAIQQATKKARYEYFIICDDDNWLDEDYIVNAYAIMKDRHDIGALGSFTEAVFEDESIKLPEWYAKNYPMLAIGSQGESGDVSERLQLWGAGLVARTEIYRKLYQKYTSFFITPGNWQGNFSAEDTEYCLRLLLKGYKLYYSDSLRLKHFVTADRLEEKYYDKLKANVEKSSKILDPCFVAVTLYGTLKMSDFNILRLKVLNPLRMILSNKKKHNKYKVLQKLFHPSGPNSLEAKVKAFAESSL